MSGPGPTVLFLIPSGDARGPAAVAAFEAAARRLGLKWSAACRDAFAPDERAAAKRVVAIGVRPEFPVFETWDDDRPDARVMGLIATLLGRTAAAPPAPPPPPPPKKILTAKVGRETAGRKGKGVTTVFDLSVPESEFAPLATALKTACGTGGTVKDGRIEIQGDQRDRVAAELEKRGFRVKRAGG